MDNGLLVRAEQIKEPDSPSPNFLILHYNSLEAIDAILNHEKFIAYIKNPDNFTNSIVHIVENSKENIVES